MGGAEATESDPPCRMCAQEVRTRKIRVQISYGRYECIFVCRDCETDLAAVIGKLRE